MAEAEKATSTIKDLEIDGYKFTVDTDLLDDVEAFEHIDRIENKNQVVAVVPLLKFLIGDKGYEDMKQHYIKLDAEEHKDQKDYKGKFRVSKLSDVYKVIVDNFDPKG